ncbi:hypothetical protein [Pseudomonas sp. KCJK8521]|uniref:hypothetical protein n=1 Tax=Pseudomonas sp. KCJK8521 TaxID=3344557 RepID=UPI00390677AB
MESNLGTIRPNISFVSPQYEISLFSSLKNPEWVLEGEKLGTLLGKDGGAATYTAPDSIVKGDSSDIISFFKKDIVTAFEDGKYYNATILISNLPRPVSYKLELKTDNNQKRLEFLVNIFDSGWTKVPEEHTAWYTLAGNGRMKQNGDYYSSGDQPTPTAILAFDKRHDKIPGFAIIILDAD